MARTTTTTVLQHECDSLAPQSEPSFADVVYVLTTPPPDADAKKAWNLSTRISRYVALFAYSLAHPQQFALWINDACKVSETIEEATYPEVRREWADAAKAKVAYAFSVATLFLSAPQGPTERAREAVVRPMPVYGPPENGTVRIKWYPDLEATKRWPAGLRQLWVDVSVDRDGCVDLKFVMDLWGMQNCYVIDANRSKPQLWRRRVEKLSALAINVLLADGHKVVGVVERPSEYLQVAREYRAYVKHRARPFKALPRFLWETIMLLATIAFNLIAYAPYFLWFIVCSSPYILFHALEIIFRIFFTISTLVVNDLEELGYAVQDCVAPHVCLGLGIARGWLVAGLEAAFLTDEEIQQRVGSEVSDE
ncbi:hypothetical protein LXA43DRAFT_891083 [Ganoderma leucocontextum]|nr:hypothetical protein LXA43DRAFT_891083 [Ganoderma leucocontextum]